MAQQNNLSDRFELVKILGKGSFSVVVSVICKVSKIRRAVKLIHSIDEFVDREIDLLMQPKYHHESVIRCYSHWRIKTDSLSGDWKKLLEYKHYRSTIQDVMTALEFDQCDGKQIQCIESLILLLIRIKIQVTL